MKKISAVIFVLLPAFAFQLVAQGIDSLKFRILPANEMREDFNYLRRLLEETHPGLYRYSTKEQIKAKFRQGIIKILLCTESASEGLNLQTCGVLINYDMPWNPMRVEQRIGRIDRNGQKSEFVSIYNLITPGTVDADIYERCLLRIGIFEQALGASEDIHGKAIVTPTPRKNLRREKVLK